METDNTSPAYRFTQAELAQLADLAVKLIDRDGELSAYGIDTAFRQTLVAKTILYKETPTDEELLGMVTAMTEQKNALADELKVIIRSIMVRARVVFGEKSPEYRAFGTRGLDKLDDDKLYRCARSVKRCAVKWFSALEPKGLTQDDIDLLEQKSLLHDDAIDKKIEAVANRDIATETRVRLGNEIYGMIIEMFDFGKDYWSTRNEAKYNDYVVYDNQPVRKVNGKEGNQ
jgi:hypothetical protein